MQLIPLFFGAAFSLTTMAYQPQAEKGSATPQAEKGSAATQAEKGSAIVAYQPQAEKPTAWAPQAENPTAWAPQAENPTAWAPQAENPTAWAATATEQANIQLTASTTASTCAANGAVTATVTGINVSEWDITYGLNPVDEGGAIFARQTAATIEHVPPGNYTLTAELVGRSGTAQAGQAQRLRMNVTVESRRTAITFNYVPFTSATPWSRASAATCATGRVAIALPETSQYMTPDGLPWEPRIGTWHPYRFRIAAYNGTTAPDESTATEVDGRVVNTGSNVTFLLDPTLAAGRYRVWVSDKDGCAQTDARDITVEAITTTQEARAMYEGNNTFAYGRTAFTAVSRQATCEHVWAYVPLSTSGVHREVNYAWGQGEYQLALTAAGGTPTESDWQPTAANVQDQYLFTLPEGTKVSDYYVNNSGGRRLRVWMRRKDCATATRNFLAQIPTPRPTVSFEDVDCANYAGVVSFDALQRVCFPVNVRVRNLTTNTYLPDDYLIATGESSARVPLSYGIDYQVETYDANGLLLLSNRTNRSHQFTRSATQLKCEGYRLQMRATDLDECLPFVFEVRRIDNNTLVDRVAAAKGSSVTTQVQLEYGVKYLITAVLPSGGTVDFGSTGEYSYTRNDYGFTFRNYEPGSGRRRQQATLRFDYPNEGNQRVTIVVTGPNNFRRTFTAYNDYMTQEVANLVPGGTYTAHFTTPCGEETRTAVFPGGIDVEDFAIARQAADCEGLTIWPAGRITYQGRPDYRGRTINPAFRVISGPKDGASYAAQATYALGTPIKLRVPGTYEVAIFDAAYPNAYGNLDTLSITFAQQPLQLAEFYSFAYACQDNSSGHIFARAEGGTPPYTYELRNPDVPYDPLHPEQGRLTPTSQEMSTEGVIHFEYGTSGSRVAVLFRDQCGSYDLRKLDITPLLRKELASTPQPELCAGETIVLRAFRGLTNCVWTAPDGTVVGSGAEVSIPRATPSMSGTYTLTARSAYCNQPVTATLTIAVHPCFAPVNPHLPSRPWREGR